MQNLISSAVTRRLPGAANCRALYSREQLWLALDQERARSDRNGREFALVLFRPVPDNGHTPAALAQIGSALLTRLRSTDQAGWFSDECLCALLPDTSAEGAGAFVRHIKAQLGGGGTTPSTTIYAYPSAWLPAGGDHRRENSSDPGSSHDKPGNNGNGGGNGQEQHHGVNHPEQSTAGNHPRSLDDRYADMFVLPLPRWKRLIDVVVAAIGLAMVSPLMAAVAAAVKMSSRGPVIFRQPRSGEGGRVFVMYKFRTMVDGAELHQSALRELSEQDGPAFKMRQDPRITKVGRFLRNTSLDELPQLWNVLKGDMTLVGPRPLPCRESDACMPWQRRRLDVKPGITCIWQVSGRSRVTFTEWMRMDRQYIRNRRMLLDLKILLKTAPAVLRGRGAH